MCLSINLKMFRQHNYFFLFNSHCLQMLKSEFFLVLEIIFYVTFLVITLTNITGLNYQLSEEVGEGFNINFTIYYNQKLLNIR